SRYGFTSDGRVVFAAGRDGLDSVWVLDLASGDRSPLPGPDLTYVEHLVVRGTTVALVGGAPTAPASVWRGEIEFRRAAELRGARPPLEPEWISAPQPLTFPTSGSAQEAHALLYLPTSGDHVAPDGELPPLI